MSHHHSDASDDLSYEDFDDIPYTDDDDLDVIDLDALDDEIETDDEGNEKNAAAIDPATGELLDKLDDALPPTGPQTAQPRRTTSNRARPNMPAKPASAPKPAASAPDDAAAKSAPAPQPTDAEKPKPAAASEPAPQPSDQPKETPAAKSDTPAPTRAASHDTPASTTQGAKAPAAAKPTPESKPAPAKTPPAAAAPSVEDAAPEPEPDWVYHVLIALPDALRAEVLALRAAGNIVDMPPPGVLLGSAFRTTQIDAVQEALTRWTRNHLPLQIERVGVWTEVVGQQSYVAAWSLEPGEELQEAQHNLRRALADLITPLPTARTAIQVHLAIGEQVPARRYPHLIGQMQRDFEPYVWHANDLLLVRRNAAASSEDKDAASDQWDTAATYH